MLRLLLPLIVGIFLADACWPFFTPAIFQVCFIAFGLSLSSLLGIAFLRRGFFRELFAPLLYICLGLIGFGLTALALHKASFSFTDRQEGYAVLIMQTPEEKERSILCKSVIEAHFTVEGEMLADETHGKTFLLYLAKDFSSLQLRKGDRLLVYARLSPASNNGIPKEFDYPRYLLHQGVSGTAYVAGGNWEKVGHTDDNSWLNKLQQFRNRVTERYADLGFKGDELAILSALTVGEKSDLSEDIKEIYSIAGSSHVLAISGLHLGLIYAILWFLFTPLWHANRRLRVPLTFAILASLWLYAAMVGFPASLVRSAIMFSLIGISSLMVEKPHSFNTLATAAFLMLLVRPIWLFEVGFQMSFAAVFAIVWLQPKLSALIPVKNRMLRWIRDLLSLSIAAQVGVAPIIMYYFHRFSVHFLLSNLFIVPMVTLVMYVAVLMLLLTPFPLIQQQVAYGLNVLLKVQNAGLECISSLPMASIDRIWIDRMEVVGCYLLVWLVYRFVRQRTAPRLIVALSVALLLFGYHVGAGYVRSPQRSIVFYNVRGCPAVHCIANARHSWIAASDSMQQVVRLCKQASPFWMWQRMSEPAVLTASSLESQVFQDNQIVAFAGVRIGLLNDNRWRYKESSHRIRLDYLYVSSGFQGRLEELLQLFDVGEVIIDSSLSDFYRNRLELACAERDIPVHRMSEEGILKFEL